MSLNFSQWISRLGNEIALLEVNAFQTRSGEQTSIHAHLSQLHIAVFDRGSGTLTLNGVTSRLHPGDIYLICPGEIHQFKTDVKHPYHAFFLHLSWFGPIPPELPRHLLLPRQERPAFFRLCRTLAECCHRPATPETPLQQYSLLLRIFAEWLRIARETAAEPARSGLQTGLDRHLNPILHALQGPPFYYPGIDALAAKAGLSRHTLTTLFRKFTGFGIKQYYLANMMNYAEFMRRNGSYRTSEIARQCGYSSVQNFLLARKNFLRQHPAPAVPADFISRAGKV